MRTLTRKPVRISEQGTFILPGMSDCKYSIGHEVAPIAVEELRRETNISSVDTESAGLGLKRYDLKCVTISTDNHAVLLDPRDPYQFQSIRTVLNDGRQLIFHNSVHDVPILYALGLLDLETVWKCFDTLLYARLANPDEKTSKGLRNSANLYLGMDLDDPMPRLLKVLGISKQTWFETKDLDTPTYRIMAASDALLTYRLLLPARQAAYRQLTEGHPFSTYGITGTEAEEEVEKPQILNRILLRQTCLGFAVDTDYLDNYRAPIMTAQQERTRYLEDLLIKPGNPNSLAAWLEAHNLVPDDYPRTATGRISTAKTSLPFLDNEVATVFMAHKEVLKADGDYLQKPLDTMDDDGRIHPQCNILAATTGRMSYGGDWPVHQIPEPLRGTLLTDPGETWTSIDWAQIESVLMMNVAGEISSPSKVLQRYESGEDLFQTIATMIGEKRKDTKTVVYGTLFGEGNLKLAYQLGYITSGDLLAIQNVCEAHQGDDPKSNPEWTLRFPANAAEYLGIAGYVKAMAIKTAIFEQMPRTDLLMQKYRKIAKEHKKVFTLAGRILPIPYGFYNGRWSVQSHKGINYPVQGGAYDMLAYAVIEAHKQGLSDAIRILMHDEIVCETSAAHDIRKIMETPPDRLVMLAKRVPILRTDMVECLNNSWTYPCEKCGQPSHNGDCP